MNIEKEAELFEQWWDDEGQYHRAGGNEYCKTFAWEAWIFAKAQVVPEDSVVVSKRTITLALNSIEDDEDNEYIIQALQKLIHKVQE